MKQQQRRKRRNGLPNKHSSRRTHDHHHDGRTTKREIWRCMLVAVAFVGLVFNLFTSLSLASSDREYQHGQQQQQQHEDLFSRNNNTISAAYDEFASRANIVVSSLAAVMTTAEDSRLAIARNHTSAATEDFSSVTENLRSTMMIRSLFSTTTTNNTTSSPGDSTGAAADPAPSPPNSNTTTTYSKAGDASTARMNIAHETENITSLSCDTVNHNVVNRGNRTLLGQGDERILVVGLPKCGTSSLAYFFRQRNGDKNTVCDLYCKIPKKRMHLQHAEFRQRIVRNGICMQKAKDYGLPLLETCGNVSVYAQLDAIMPPRRCHFPQITMLEEIHQEHPTATFVLNMRNRVHWSHSVYNWKQRMPARLAHCPDGPRNEKHYMLQAWYCEHVQRIRQFVTEHPSHALVEVDIESADTGSRLAEIFGGKPGYWKRQNANPDNVITNP